MKLVVLGTAGYHPNEMRHTTCVMVPAAGLIFDAGSSMFRVPNYLATDQVDIFLSHTHLDHVVGLTFLLGILHQHPLKEVRVHGQESKLRAIREHLFSSDLFPVEPPFVSVPLREPVTLNDRARISFTSLNHPGGSVGYRVDWPDRSLAYITDTTASMDAKYVEFIRDVDLLLHECHFEDGHEELAALTGHSCLTPVAEVARNAGVGKLVLFHFNPTAVDNPVDVETVRSIFAPIVLATDTMEVDF